MNENLFNVSSSPHIRQDLTTGKVMLNVIIALMPASIFGVYHFGVNALCVIVAAILASVITEFCFNFFAKKKNTLTDGSAVVTGLLLALSLSPSVPLYIPIIGGVFAILVVKCFFGGLGKNFMNPALAARCFLLISFGTQMTTFAVDGVSSSTPLAAMKAGETIRLADTYLGFSNSVIGGSALALLIGGLYLWVSGGITIHIPAAVIVTFTLFMGLFGGHGFDIGFLLTNLFAGGILMGAFFMATDPVTSPLTTKAETIYGIIIGILAGLFRVKGASADSVSYAIIIANMFSPLLDKLPVIKPLGYRDNGVNGEYKTFDFPKAAINLCGITLIAGFILSGVFAMTKDKIAEQALLKDKASYQAVLPDAVDFEADADITSKVEASGDPYNDGAIGKTMIKSVVVGKDANGDVAGYAISATTHEGFDGDITMTVGITPDGTVTAISFTELAETAGMGMRADEPEFKDQFAGVQTDAFTLNKSGGSTEASDINTISGASTTSGAVVNAVNTALDFFNTNLK